MISFEDAKKIAVEYIGSNHFFVEQAVIEKPYGWYFVALDKHFHTEVPDGDTSIYFLVERDNGRIIYKDTRINSPDSFLNGFTRLSGLTVPGSSYFSKVSSTPDFDHKILSTAESGFDAQNLLKFCPEYCRILSSQNSSNCKFTENNTTGFRTEPSR